MKKILVKLVFFAMIAILGFALIACGDESAPANTECAHEFGDWTITKRPSCTQEGEKKRYCRFCPEMETETIATAGHDFRREKLDEEFLVSAATCTSKAVYVKSCFVCGVASTETFEYGKLIDHDWGEWVIKTEATCTKVGSKRRDCKNCDKYETETIEREKHTFEDGICKVCGQEGTEGLEYTINADTCSVKKYNGTEKEVFIPKTYKGKAVVAIDAEAFNYRTVLAVAIPSSVTGIGNSAFVNCHQLTSVEMADSVTSIGTYAFSNCYQLMSVEMSNGVTSIGSYAFNNCAALTSIEIPNSVTHIYAFAFYGCKKLTSIEIPASVTHIGQGVFVNCPGLTEIKVDEDNEDYYSSGNCVIEPKSCSLIAGCNASVIPDDENVTHIQSYAFGYCQFTSIEIPAKIWMIDNGAFNGCSEVTSITVDKNNVVYHSDGNCLIETKSKTLVLGCNASVIPSDGSVTSIGPSVFESCIGLTSIEIPNNVTYIGQCAFYNCSGLTDVVIPDSVTNIGFSAFLDTPWYDSQSDGEVYLGKVFYKYKGTMSENTSVKIKDGTKGIAEYAFADSDNLISIKLPDSLKVIGHRAFDNCKGLTSIEIPDSVTDIDSWAFYDCSELARAEIADGVTNIGPFSFYGCEKLMCVTIPNSVNSIGEGAFENCKALAKIDFGGTTEEWKAIQKGDRWDFYDELYIVCCADGGVVDMYGFVYELDENNETYVVTEYDGKYVTISIAPSIQGKAVTGIGERAFSYSQLLSATIPDSVANIGDDAFRGCEELSSVTLEFASGAHIGDRAFYGCWALTRIDFGGTVSEWQAIEKGDEWDLGTPDYTVYCTDGTVSKNGLGSYN